jgi:hypothetical protein
VSGGTLAAVSGSAKLPYSLRPSCRVGFGTWTLAVQLRLKPLARRIANVKWATAIIRRNIALEK